jgi:AcrR family transcriptional regulator
MYVGYVMNQTPTSDRVDRGRPPGLRDAHVQDTRRVLLDTARLLFTEHGFQATRTEELVRRAGLTRGALYHHFRDKEDLFRAVFEEVSAEVVQLLHRRSSDGATNAWELFRANSEVYLDAASTNRAYRQIVLIDGPAVLGWTVWSGRGDGPTHKILEYLADAVAEGVLEAQPLEPLAHALSALGVGSAMYVAHAEDPAVARREIGRCNERLLAGLGVGADRPAAPVRTDRPTRGAATGTRTKGRQ